MNKHLSGKLILGVLGVVIVLGLIGLSVSLQQPVRSLQRNLGDAFKRRPIPSTRAAVEGETQYLVFVIQVEGIYEAPKGRMAEVIDQRVGELIDRIGSVGDSSRKLGFTVLIPPWIVEKALPGKFPIAVKEIFEVARKRDVAAHFSIETHYFWDTRPDLWNYFDSSKPGYDPNNKNNVEWVDWNGTPYPARYVDWGTPQKLAPHMCYNAPRIRSEIARLVSQFIVPPIKAQIDDLKRDGLEHLFAGITVGSEASLDNYEGIDGINMGLARFMEKNKARKARLGYNALRNAGYSQANPPKDINHALAEVNQEFIARWAKHLVDAGIPSSRLYTHMAANSGYVGSPVLEFTNAPIWIAFNDYSRPGWTTYPDGPLEKSFDLLYQELKKHGNPAWGGTEANPQGLGDTRVPAGEYLRRHFDHGAKLMVMNTGSSGRELTEKLNQGVWSKESVAQYRSFLGGTLTATPARERETQAPAQEERAAERTFGKADEQRIRNKVEKVGSTLQELHSKRGDPAKVAKLAKFMEEIDTLLKAQKVFEAEAKADEAIEFINKANVNR